MNIDDIVLELQKIGWNNLNPLIPLKDLKILKSIASCIVSPAYITEAQANLVVKILRENLEYIDNQKLDISTCLKNIKWSNTFRVIKKERNVEIITNENSEIYIKIASTWDRQINKILFSLEKILNSEKHLKNIFPLNEKSIIEIYRILKPLNFNFSAEFLEFLDKVQSIDLEKTKNQFVFENFYQSKKDKLNQFDIFENSLIQLDRKIRYQYVYDSDFDENTKKTLEYKIANRSDTRVYVSNYTSSFDNLVNALRNLKRDKILLVFDMNKIDECLYYLDKVKNYTNQNELNSYTGIYFRFDNKDKGSEFNKIISDNMLNALLSKSSKLVGVSTSKLPKFLPKSDWYPDAVISFTTSLRNNKTDVYCNDCDCIVYYTNTKPLISNVHEIL
ncbi:MAG: hypothetical protein EBT86_00585 [Actinobacteria bacterium]|nr:hypothetical protein [Actinomycetota bacterium]